MAKEIEFKITEHILDLSDANDKGWKKEFNMVSWNGGEPKYDIRQWNEDHSRMGKGITLSYDELALMVSECYDRGIC